MSLPEPPTYTVQELERTAQDFLLDRLGDDVSLPIDIDLLIEKTDGVDLDIWPGLEANHNISGMVARDVDTGEFVVLIDSDIADRSINFYRSTTAEELSHILLHRKQIESVSTPQEFRQLQSHYRWFEMERNAKRCGAAILMPASKVVDLAEKTYPRLAKVAGYSNAEAIKKYLASQLAQRFQVSAKTMQFRLGEWPMKIFERVDLAVQEKLDYLP